MNGKKILISGYYGFGNAGDELILKTLIDDLKKLNPTTITVLSHRPEKTRMDFAVASASRWSPFRVLRELSRADLLIFGGGGLLQDQTRPRSLWYYLGILWMARLMRRKTAVYRIGAGPLKSAFHRWMVGWTLNAVDFISVRDEASKKELERCGVKREMLIAPDPVFSLRLQTPERLEKERPRIAFIVRKMAPREEKKVRESLAEAASLCVRKLNAEVFITSFHPEQDAPSERKLKDALGKMDLPEPERIKSFDWYALDDLIDFLGGVDLALSMRYHGILLSALQGVPAVGIEVDPKIRQLSEALYPSSEEDSQNVIKCERLPDELFPLIQRAWRTRGQLARQARDRIEAARAETEDVTVRALASLLKKEPSSSRPAELFLPKRASWSQRWTSRWMRGGPSAQRFNRLRSFFSRHWALFACSILVAFLFSVLYTLQRDGRDIFINQKDALVLEVFSRTDLPADSYPLLEESLRTLDGVSQVVAASPEEGLRRLSADSQLPVDPDWLNHKSLEGSKDKTAFLPWRYSLHLTRWDEPFLMDLASKIERIEIGIPKTKAVAEVHYDRERWSLIYALMNYLQWLSMIFTMIGAFGAGFMVVSLIKLWRRVRRHPPKLSASSAWHGLWPRIAFGLCAGIVCHMLYLFILSRSFFLNSFTWRNELGELFLPQILIALLVALFGTGFESEREKF